MFWILWVSGYDLLELAVGLAAFLFGLRLAQAPNTFAIPSFAAMALLAPEWVWALGFALFGVVHMIAVIEDEPFGRAFGSLLGASVWTFAAYQFLAAEARSAGPAFCATVALASALCHIRKMRDGGLQRE